MLLFDKDSQKPYIKFREFVKRFGKIEQPETEPGSYQVRDWSLKPSKDPLSLLFPV